MTEKIIVAGFGGQGIMIMSKFLSCLAVATDRFTTYLPAYGAEVRGGTAHCMVIISDEEIYSPLIEKADSAIIMNEPSLVRFENRIKEGGVLFLNKSLVNIKPKRNDFKTIEVPFSGIAQGTGNIKCANAVALGAYLAYKKIAPKDKIYAVLYKMLDGLSKEIIALNQKALEEGLNYAKCN